MNAHIRSVLRPLLVALVLSVGISQAAQLDRSLDSVREGLQALTPALQSASMLPFVGELLHALVREEQEPSADLESLFEETFSGPSFEGLERAVSDPWIDEVTRDDLALLEQ